MIYLTGRDESGEGGGGVKIGFAFLYCPHHGEEKDDSFGIFGLHFQNFSTEWEALFPVKH